MRFCPFCSAENEDTAASCSACGRRLPPLPPRRRNRIGEDTPAPPSSLPPRERSLGDLAPGPAAARRVRPVEIPSAEGRRKDDRPATGTLPLPSRTERDQRAASAGGFAPETAAAAEVSRSPRRRGSPTEWPAPKRPIEPDPDDWNIDPAPAAARPRTSPPPTPPPRPRTEPASRPVSEPAPPPSEPAPRLVSEPAPRLESEVAPRPESEPPLRLRTEPPELPARADSQLEPPPTRTLVADRKPFEPPKIKPIPEVPEAGLWPALRYSFTFVRARWQRRSAIKTLRAHIAEDTTLLDGVLGTLGQHVRALGVEHRSLAAENEAIDEAEKRRHKAEHDCAELSNRQADENSKSADIESERQQKTDEVEIALEKAQNEVGSLEAQKRGLRDKRKDIERRQKGYLKAAEDRESEATKQEMGDQRAALRRAAEEMRRDAAALDPERQDLERRLSALDKPISQGMAKVESLKAEVESARRSLHDAREGHRHRLAEIEAEQGRKSRELAQAEAEIQRRLVTLGTLVNLNRIDRPEFSELYAEIDVVRGAIGARSNEIDRLTAEREAYDRASLVRGGLVAGAMLILVLTIVAVALAMQ